MSFDFSLPPLAMEPRPTILLDTLGKRTFRAYRVRWEDDWMYGRVLIGDLRFGIRIFFQPTEFLGYNSSGCKVYEGYALSASLGDEILLRQNSTPWE